MHKPAQPKDFLCTCLQDGLPLVLSAVRKAEALVVADPKANKVRVALCPSSAHDCGNQERGVLCG